MKQTQYKVDPMRTGGAWVGEEVRDAQPIQLRSDLATIDLAPVDVSPVFASVHDGARDSVSAQDRAWGYNIRLLPALLVCVLLAGMGTLAFALSMRYLAQPVDGLWYTFVFLLCLVASFLTFAVTLNRTDYQHSRAGVERHRISTAADLRKHEIDALLTLRREALRHTLKLIERKD